MKLRGMMIFGQRQVGEGKPRWVLKWAVVFSPVIMLIIYLGSYFYFRVRCNDDRYIPMPLGSSSMRSVRIGFYSGFEPFVPVIKKLIPPKDLIYGAPVSYGGASPSFRGSPDRIVYKDPYLYLPEKLERFLNKGYSPVQAFDYCLNGWAVGFNSHKKPFDFTQ